ncbi:E3 ubiquitin-protein ligase RBBP6-like, partial [Puntigrus tetrazona]|uniref:E3 ubiquitin-protein ligase RBBP6-like n=1 Tax=Puntigrus tetrazona TaxID=1606681 RepID=UPI001C89C9B4
SFRPVLFCVVKSQRHDLEGVHVTVRELKRQIMRREGLKLCDLRISSVQTSEEYTEDEALVPNNTSVIIRRDPALELKSTNKSFVSNRPDSSCGSSPTVLPVKQTENLAEANASEEDKLKAVMFQSSLCYYSSSDAMKLVGLLPPNYICFCCRIPGLHIKTCLSNMDMSCAPHKRIRRCAGIPPSFLVEVDDPDREGVMMDSSGKYVIPVMDADAYALWKKKKPAFSPQNEPATSTSSSSSSDPVPATLLCLICKDLLNDAVMIPCCRSSYCDECERPIKQTSARNNQPVSDHLLMSGIITCLLESDGRVCPTCRQPQVPPDSLTANTVLRQVRPCFFLWFIFRVFISVPFLEFIFFNSGGGSF